MPKKVKTTYTHPKATRIFTDREEPRNSFWKLYNLTKDNMGPENDIHVLTYYGFGGIGKTSLLNQLIKEMKEKLASPYFVYYDFNVGTECRDVLTSMKTSLTNAYNFSFPLFDFGTYIYAKKVGIDMESPEVKQIIEKSPLLTVIVEAMGYIPVLNSAATVLKMADKGLAIVRTYLNNHQMDLQRIEFLEAKDLLNYLPYLFSQDLNHNLERKESPLVVFFDTYERLVNEISSVGEPLFHDLWLRGENGIISKTSNVLWVIGGREKLKWEQLDSDWEGSLEQHLLGTLSAKDSDLFLKTASVGDSELRKQLYELTKGTPVYLDLCVEQYYRFLDKGETPDISMFGTNTYELIERFARYMSDSQKDLVYMFSCLQRWNDKLISDIGGKIIANFSSVTYEKAKKLSFIIESNDTQYHIHQTVGEVLFKNCPEDIKNKTSRFAITYYSDAIQQMNLSNDAYTSTIEEYVRFLADFDYDYNTFHHHMTIMINLIITLLDVQLNNFAYTLAKKLHSVTSKRFPKSGAEIIAKALYFYALVSVYEMSKALSLAATFPTDFNNSGLSLDESLRIRTIISRAYCRAGVYETSIILDAAILEDCLTNFGETHRQTIIAFHNAIDSLTNIGVHSAVLPYAQYLVTLCKKNLKKGDRATLYAMKTLLRIYTKVNYRGEAAQINKEISLFNLQAQGKTVPEIVNAMYDYASYCESEEKERVLRKALDLCIEHFGSQHPKTIKSMSHYASCCTLSEEISMREEIINISKNILGETHPNTLTYLYQLAVAYSHLDDKKIIVWELIEEVLNALPEFLDNTHPISMYHLMQNVSCFCSQYNDRLKDAINLAERLMTSYFNIGREDREECFTVMADLYNYYVKTGDEYSAEKLNSIIMKVHHKKIFIEIPQKNDVTSMTVTEPSIKNYLELMKNISQQFESNKSFVSE